MTGRKLWKSERQGSCTVTKLFQKLVGSYNNSKQGSSTCVVKQEACQHSPMLGGPVRVSKIWVRELGGLSCLSFEKQLTLIPTEICYRLVPKYTWNGPVGWVHSLVDKYRHRNVDFLKWGTLAGDLSRRAKIKCELLSGPQVFFSWTRAKAS